MLSHESNFTVAFHINKTTIEQTLHSLSRLMYAKWSCMLFHASTIMYPVILKLWFLNELTDLYLIFHTKHLCQNSQSLVELQNECNLVVNDVPTCLVIHDRWYSTVILHVPWGLCFSWWCWWGQPLGIPTDAVQCVEPHLSQQPPKLWRTWCIPQLACCNTNSSLIWTFL